MDLEAKITFPGGKRVSAELSGQTIPTDQPTSAGGEGAAPEPFALFAASIGTCAGFYVLSFCQSRGLPVEGLVLRERLRYEDKTLVAVELDVELPDGFPERYRAAVVRAADTCKVKRAIEAQPRFVVRAVPATRGS
jgi:ribosomal protein S12 methylthiotransferase accessory factor